MSLFLPVIVFHLGRGFRIGELDAVIQILIIEVVGVAIFYGLLLAICFGRGKIFMAVLLPFFFLSLLHLWMVINYGVHLDDKLASMMLTTPVNFWVESLNGFELALALIIVFTLLTYWQAFTAMPRRVKNIYLIIPAGIGIMLGGFFFFAKKEAFSRAVPAIVRINPVTPFIYSYYRGLQVNEMLSKNKNFHFGTFKKDTLNQKEIYVLVIGESSRNDHWELNGYHRPTNPCLKETGNLINYPDMVSACFRTRESAAMLVSRIEPQNYDKITEEKTIITAFKEAGFQTFWISNQQKGMFYNMDIINGLSNESDSLIHVNDIADRSIDENVLPYIEKIVNQYDKLFLIIHLRGNHHAYYDRYSPGYESFWPAGAENRVPMHYSYMKELINAYDNSILYADHVLYNIIVTLKNSGAVSNLVFTADHGEGLFEGYQKKLIGHSLRHTQIAFKVPAFVWHSEGYQNTYPEKVTELIKNKDNPVHANQLFHTLLDVANISYPEEQLKKSLASDEFIADYRRDVFENENMNWFYKPIHEIEDQEPVDIRDLN